MFVFVLVVNIVGAETTDVPIQGLLTAESHVLKPQLIFIHLHSRLDCWQAELQQKQAAVGLKHRAVSLLQRRNLKS